MFLDGLVNIMIVAYDTSIVSVGEFRTRHWYSCQASSRILACNLLLRDPTFSVGRNWSLIIILLNNNLRVTLIENILRT